MVIQIEKIKGQFWKCLVKDCKETATYRANLCFAYSTLEAWLYFCPKHAEEYKKIKC